MLSNLSPQSLVGPEWCDLLGQFLGLPLRMSLLGLLPEIPLLAFELDWQERCCEFLSLIATITDAILL